MPRLAGIPVTDQDARTLVDLLLRVGRHDDLTAATTIEHALTQQLATAPLTPDERTAILGALDDPPDGLAELRAVLLRDRGPTPRPSVTDPPTTGGGIRRGRAPGGWRLALPRNTRCRAGAAGARDEQPTPPRQRRQRDRAP